jgi:hypothetical protein
LSIFDKIAALVSSTFGGSDAVVDNPARVCGADRTDMGISPT